MNQFKVCKLVRLASKDAEGNFANVKEGRITLRERVIVSNDTVQESEANFGMTGRLYIVDKEATAERNAKVEAEQAAHNEDEVEESTETKGKAAAAKL